MEFTSRKLCFRASIRSLKLGEMRNGWGRHKKGSTWFGNYLPELFFTPQPHKNMPPYAANSNLGLKVAEPLRGREVHSILLLQGWRGERLGGVESPSCFTHYPHANLSYQKGPVCHVVGQPANMRAPSPLPAPSQVGR